MITLLKWLSLYLLCGAVLLIAFDIVTKRIRKRFKQSVLDARVKIAQSGSLGMPSNNASVVYIGPVLGVIILTVSTLTLWPLALIGAVLPGKEKESGEMQ